MTRFQTMPPLSVEERDALERSILTYGIEVPIVVDEAGAIIDGHHRKEIADALGIECPTVVESGLTDEQKVALSISLNIDRRQVTREQKRQIVAASIKADPQASDREHARRLGVSHPTVASVRRDLEGAGDVEKVSTRTDSAGREQPASKPRPVAPEVPEAEEDEPEPATPTWELPAWAARPAGASKPTEGVPSITPKPSTPSVAELLGADRGLQDSSYLSNFHRALLKAHDFTTFDAERIGSLDAEAITSVEHLLKTTTSFLERMKNGARPHAVRSIR